MKGELIDEQTAIESAKNLLRITTHKHPQDWVTIQRQTLQHIVNRATRPHD